MESLKELAVWLEAAKSGRIRVAQPKQGPRASADELRAMDRELDEFMVMHAKRYPT